MPIAKLRGVDLYFEWSGAVDGRVMVLSNSLGTDLHLWDAFVERMGGRYRLLRYDTRGHGRSSVPPGEYTLEELGGDVLQLMDYLTVPAAAVCGVSLGGLTAMWLAVQAPERVTRLIAANTAACVGTPERWTERMARVRETGLSGMVEETLSRWFTPDFLQEEPSLVAPVRAAFKGTSAEGYAGCCAALRDGDLRGSVGEIAVPALLITGTADPVTPPSEAMYLRDRMAGSVVLELPGAHLAVVENATAFAEAVARFLGKDEERVDGEVKRHADGLAVRKAVLGEAHVGRAQASTTAFNAEFQELITRYAWGEIWTRPGLPRHTRSLLTLAMMVALNRADEFRLHVRAAANNGVTREEIKEVLLQTAIYCGVPAANTAFHLAAEVFAQMDAEAGV